MAAATVAFPAAIEQTKAINPWLIAITVTLATFMELLDTAIANVSLPHIAGGLATSYDEATWVLTSYLVANAVVLPLSAWLSRVFGRKNYYMACVALFSLSSLMCGLAPSLGLLIFFRVLQGIAGGGLAPVEQAILVDTFPASKRAAAFALYSMAIVTAPAIGPPLGGWITDSFSWRWVFFINVPIGIISLVLTSRLLSDPPEFKREVEEARQAGRMKVDYLGILLIAVGFSCLEVVLDRGERLDWFESDFIVTFFVTAIVALIAAVIWELRQQDPVVELTLLKERNFALSNAFYFLFGFVLFGSTVLIPQMLQSLYGYTATDAGLVLGPGAMVIVVMAPLIVRLVKKIPVSWMIGFGFTVLGSAPCGTSRVSILQPTTEEKHGHARSGLRDRFPVCPDQPTRLLLFAEEQKQQSVESHQPFPQSGWKLRHCVRDNGARAARSIPPIGAGHARHEFRRNLLGECTEHCKSLRRSRLFGSGRSRAGCRAGSCPGAAASQHSGVP